MGYSWVVSLSKWLTLSQPLFIHFGNQCGDVIPQQMYNSTDSQHYLMSW